MSARFIEKISWAVVFCALFVIVGTGFMALFYNSHGYPLWSDMFFLGIASFTILTVAAGNLMSLCKTRRGSNIFYWAEVIIGIVITMLFTNYPISLFMSILFPAVGCCSIIIFSKFFAGYYNEKSKRIEKENKEKQEV